MALRLIQGFKSWFRLCIFGPSFDMICICFGKQVEVIRVGLSRVGVISGRGRVISREQVGVGGG